MSRKTFVGVRDGGDRRVYVLNDLNGVTQMYRFDATCSLGIWDHSPDGFNWGYGGSAPKQLALALLLEVTGCSDCATEYGAQFKEQIVAKLEDDWALERDAIWEWLEAAAKPGASYKCEHFAPLGVA